MTPEQRIEEAVKCCKFQEECPLPPDALNYTEGYHEGIKMMAKIILSILKPQPKPEKDTTNQPPI